MDSLSPEKRVKVSLCFFLFIFVFGLHQTIDILASIHLIPEWLQLFAHAAIHVVFIGASIMLIKAEGSSFREHGFWLPNNSSRYFSISALLALVYILITLFLPGSIMDFEAFPAIPLPSVFLEIVSILLTSLATETVFRGYIQTNLTRVYGSFSAICISSLMFALYKFPLSWLPGLDTTSVLYNALSPFIASIFLGFLFQKAKTLACPVTFYAALLLLSSLTPLRANTTGIMTLFFEATAYIILTLLLHLILLKETETPQNEFLNVNSYEES